MDIAIMCKVDGKMQRWHVSCEPEDIPAMIEECKKEVDQVKGRKISAILALIEKEYEPIRA